jgi:hypothetical protein
LRAHELRRLGDLCGVGHVERERGKPTPGAISGGREPLAGRAITDAREHCPPRRGEAQRSGATDAGGGARDQSSSHNGDPSGPVDGPVGQGRQTSESYLRPAKRLVGLDLLMHIGARLVKNSLGPSPRKVPAEGFCNYRGHTFRIFTLHLEAFPPNLCGSWCWFRSPEA